MRKILDVRMLEVSNLNEKQTERLNKKLDRLGVPKDATVQVNIGALPKPKKGE